MGSTANHKLQKTTAGVNTPKPLVTVAEQFCRLAVAGGVISPREGFETGPGRAISTAVHMVLIHDGDQNVVRFFQKLFGPIEAHARQMIEASSHVNRYWLETKLTRGGADLVNIEVYNDGRQEDILKSMMPFLALKGPCFYLRNPAGEKVILQGFRESFDLKIYLNFAGSDLMASLVDGKKQRRALQTLALIDRILRGETIMLPASRRSDVPRVVQGKCSAFFELPKNLFTRLITGGHPTVLRLLQQCILVDASDPMSLTGSVDRGEDEWPHRVQSVIERRKGRNHLPLIELDLRHWEAEVEKFAASRPEAAPWLAPFFDLPGKLISNHLLERGRATISSPALTKWAIDATAEVLLKQVDLLGEAKQMAASMTDEEDHSAMLRRLRQPKTFRELARSYADQRKERHWPVLAQLMAAGKIKQVDGNRYIAVTTEEPEAEGSSIAPPLPASQEGHQDGYGRA